MNNVAAAVRNANAKLMREKNFAHSGRRDERESIAGSESIESFTNAEWSSTTIGFWDADEMRGENQIANEGGEGTVDDCRCDVCE